MDKIISALMEMKEINSTYSIPTERLQSLQTEMEKAKVCTPVIGKFSTGKSALLNELLGYRNKMLKEDIIPETAIPTELVYADKDEYVIIIKNDDEETKISNSAYRNYEVDAKKEKCARLYLRNSFLGSIPDIVLVDMPGFESGLELHNKAIDDYLPKSMAYIVTFSADDLVVRSSVGNVLKELCVYNMPFCIAVTKFDKRNTDFEIVQERFKQSLKRYVGERDIKYCLTSSREHKVEEVQEFLREIQERSQEILADKYKNSLVAIIENTENYLKTLLNGSQISQSELEEKEDELHRQFSLLDSRFIKEQEDFRQEISSCVAEIQEDLLKTLEAKEETIIAMVLNNQNVTEFLNTIVRNSVAVSLKRRFFTRVEKYVRRVKNIIDLEMAGDVNISCSFDTSTLQKDTGSQIVSIAAGYLLGGILGAVIAGFFSKFCGDKKREEAKQRIRRQLKDEVFPQIVSNVGNNIESEVIKQADFVNTAIKDEIMEQKKLLEGAMAEVRGRMQKEKEEKERFVSEIQATLGRVGALKDGL